MRIRIDHKLRISLSELPKDIESLIIEALTIPNQVRLKAEKNNIWGWQQIPEEIALWDRDERDIIMPRGFLPDLLGGLSAFGIDYALDDLTAAPRLFPVGKVVELHPWQKRAVPVILSRHGGIWKAPAGSGKTVGVLEAIRRAATRSLVIVNTKDILWQWQTRCRDFLGDHFPVGQIGDDVFEVSPYMTIAIINSLHTRFDELESSGFFDSFGFVCLDECHHATAETYNKVVDRFSSHYRIGVSATPDKTGDFALATAVLGPIIHETRVSEVSTLMVPEVRRIYTKFGFRFSSNYDTLLRKLISDDDRNELIVRALMNEQANHGLVISKRLEHLNMLSKMLHRAGYTGKILKLTGEETSQQRKDVIKDAMNHPSMIFSTLADEALDIPRLDRLFLVFPQRNPGLITQQVGRVERVCDGKKSAIIYDFTDMKVGPCEAQWRIRRTEVYGPRGYRITNMKADDV